MARERIESKPIATIIGFWLIGFAVFLATVFAALMFVVEPAAARVIAAAGGALLAGFIGIAWLFLHRLARPLDRLALDVAIIARENPGHRVGLVPRHWLPRLAASIEALRSRLERAVADGAQALAAAQQQGTEQKRWLEAILLDLTEGIVVCNLQH